jgi:hypothetical protein
MSPTPAKPASPERARAAVPELDSSRAVRVVLAAWLVPGGGHALLGDARRAAIFFIVLTTMVVVGLAFDGRLFPFQISDPLGFLAAAAQWALLAPRLFAASAGLGAGGVTETTYEYGTTFLIVSGLLNALVLLDAFDRARGRRTT